MKKNVFDPLFQPFLIIILAVSGLLVASTSVLTPTGLYPDERAHFGYAYGIYQQNLDPLFDRTKILTDGTEYNHLRHPPAYYFLAAGAMAILKLDKDLANSTLSSSKYYRQVTRTLIPPLRITSLALYLVHIFAVYYLLCYLVSASMLTRTTAIFVALLVLFIPSRTFIAGAVSNDALSITVWPLIALFGIKMLREPSIGSFLLLGSFAAIAALTKLTVAIVAIPIVGAVLAKLLIDAFFRWRAGTTIKSEISSQLRKIGSYEILCLLFFIFAIGSFSIYYGNMLIKYGSPSVSYTRIYDLGPGENKFHNTIPPSQAEIEKTSALDIAVRVVKGSWSSTTGIFGHYQIYYDGNTNRELLLVSAGILISVIPLLVFLFHDRGIAAREAILISSVMIFTMFLFYAIWSSWVYKGWISSGRIALQGRYSIRALEFGIVGLFVAWGGLATSANRTSRVLGTVGGVLLFLLLAPAFFKPLLYARMEENSYFEAKGPSRLDVTPLRPNWFKKLGFVEKSRRDFHTNYFRFGSDGVAEVSLPLGQPVELAIWARGDPALDRSYLRIGSETIEFEPNVTVKNLCIADPRPGTEVAAVLTDAPLLKKADSIYLLGIYGRAVESCP